MFTGWLLSWCSSSGQRGAERWQACGWCSCGTGSQPPAANGWQRASRRTASQLPYNAPKRRMDSREYSLQLGANRQRWPSNGLTTRW